VDRPLIEKKLESLRRCLFRIREKCPVSAEALAQDPDAQDIVVLNLTRAVQLCVDIGLHVLSEQEVPPPETMGGTFYSLGRLGIISGDLASRMTKAVGFRNIAVHSYEEIDWQIVHAIATCHREDFAEFAVSIARLL